jgi:hypothetical protein
LNPYFCRDIRVQSGPYSFHIDYRIGGEKVNTKEICALLGITREGLRTLIKRDQLATRLLEHNYELISIEKKGRNNIYNIREIVIVPKETWNEIASKEFPRVKKVDELGIHAKERLINGSVLTKDILSKTKVTRQTAERWDGLLVEKGLMTNNGYSYYRITKSKLTQITYEEYLDYWRHFNKTKVDAEDLVMLAEGEHRITSKDIHVAQNGLCVKVKSYLVNQFTEKYQQFAAALDQN